MNTFQQNNFPQIKSLVDLASIPVAEKLLENPSYYNLFDVANTTLKEKQIDNTKLPQDLKAPVFSALSKLLTQRVGQILKSDPLLEGISLNTDDHFTIRNSIRQQREGREGRVEFAQGIFFGSAIAMFGVCIVLGQVALTSSDPRSYAARIVIGVAIPCSWAMNKLSGYLQRHNVAFPQSSLMPELSRLLDIIYGIIEVIEKNDEKDIRIEHTSEVAIYDLTYLKELFNLDSLNGNGNYSYSQGKIREILIEFDRLSERFDSELYTKMLEYVFKKLSSKLKTELVEVKVERPAVATHSGCQFLPPPKPVVGLKKVEQLSEIKINETLPAATRRKLI
jgi:hypothetical protein